MHRFGPYAIAALVFASAAAWSLHLAAEPDPFDLSSAAAIAIGLVVFALIALTGLVLSRGRWSRNLALVVVGATLGLAVALDPGPWYVVGLIATGAALVGLTGPWLTGWVRKLPAADGPGTGPIVLVFVTLGLVPLVGVASPSGLDLAHGLLGGAGALLAWGYARAEIWALWGMRTVVAVLAAGAIVQSPWGGKVLIAAAAGTVVWIAWTGEAYRAVRPLMDRLPGPRTASPPVEEPPA